MGMFIGKATIENSLEAPQKTKNRVAIWSNSLTLGHILDKTTIQSIHVFLLFIAALFTIAKTWEQPKCSLTDEWMKKMCHIYHTMWSQSEREKQNTIWYPLYVESTIWRKWTYLWNRNIHRHREQTYDCQVGDSIRERWIGSLGLADAN